MKTKDAEPPPISKATLLSIRFWQNKAAEYIRSKRDDLGRGQKQVGVVRQTLSLIENSKSNFTIKTLVQALEAVGGDISEVFESPLPKELRGEHRVWHEMLYEIIKSEDPEDFKIVEYALTASYERIVERRRRRSN